MSWRVCARACAPCVQLCVNVNVWGGRGAWVGGANEPESGSNPSTWLPALGPGDVAATSALATAVLRQRHDSMGSNNSNDDFHLPGGSSGPGVLRAAPPLSSHDPGRKGDMPISQTKKGGPRQVQGPALASQPGDKVGLRLRFHPDVAFLPHACLPRSL